MPQPTKRREISITWKGEDGVEFTTKTHINGTEDEIIAYYMGNVFNVGKGAMDYYAKAVAVDFIDVKEIDIGGINKAFGGL